MGFGGFLKKWALPIASIAAIPFTGGASAMALGMGGGLSAAQRIGNILDTAGKVSGALSPVLGQAAGARAGAQQQEEVMGLSRDRINQDAAQSNFLNTMAARKYNQDAPNKRVSSGARAALGAAGPVTFNRGSAGGGVRGRNSSFTGGYMAAMADPRMRDVSNRAMEQNIAAQLNGDDRMAMPQAIPGATPRKGSGIIDKALGVGAFGTGVMGALGKFVKKPRDPRFDRPDDKLTNVINPMIGERI